MCMCGDIRCWSCGPAQGNHKCPVCGKWDDEGGCEYPEVCEDALNELYDEEARRCEQKESMEELYGSPGDSDYIPVKA